MKKVREFVSRIPFDVKIVFCAFPIILLLHLLFSVSEIFSESYLRTVGAFFRTVLAWLTNFFPISIAEAMIIFVPVAVVIVIVLIVRTYQMSRDYSRIICRLISIVIVVYELFVLTFAAGFYVRDIGEMYGIKRREISLDELYSATVICAEGANARYDEIDGRGPEFTTMGMSLDELNSKLLKSFDILSDEYGYPVKLWSRVKPVVLSEPMTYTHISGIYTFFTGEANINVNFPDFIIPFTAAHELSHQRGVSREDEANFVAFMVCIASNDAYVRYSGYLNMLRYMSQALYSVSPEKYGEVYELLSDGVKAELYSYSRFFDKYRENVAASVSDAVNDTYLSVMSGTDSRSYGMVVDLAALYLLEK
ncbi:MAG: DUF3810 domain-containing protein [Ruminococcaceae bacterium]|nr:DUF3810 domain-containing protein [Oscillospiraceae bacterium]